MAASSQPAPEHALVPAVAMRGISKRFPGVVANDRVDFDVLPGEVHALLGENGAGKSTLSSILTGLYRPDEGEILIDGVPVTFESPRDAIAAGIGMVHQHFRLVEPFTVAENVTLGDPRERSLRVDRRAVERRIAELAARYGLAVNPRARIWELSVGEQQRVEILKALYREARILVLDEPTAVLTPQESEGLFEAMRQLARDGASVVFISHKLNEVLAVSQRVTVLSRGRSIATLPTAEASAHSLAVLMVGREFDERPPAGAPRAAGAAVLELDEVRAAGSRGTEALCGVSLRVGAGEIVAVAGVAGNGQRELAETITGLRAASAGSVRVAGAPLRLGDPRSSQRAGIAFVPEDRVGTGVAPGLSIAANLALRSYRERANSRGPILLTSRIRERALELIARYRIAAPGPAAPARILSGGNMQKLVVAREFSGEPRLVVAASPTRGLDVGAAEAVRDYLREAAARGAGVLVISEDLDEILQLADRILVMYEGRLVGERRAAGARVEEIGLLMAGAGQPAP